MSSLVPGERSLATVARACFTELGSRAKHSDLVDLVRRNLTLSEFETWSTAAMRRAVLAAVKSRAGDKGADAVYGTGEELSALRFFTVEEFEAKAHQVARLSASNRSQVYRLADICAEVHDGRTFSADEVLSQEDAA